MSTLVFWLLLGLIAGAAFVRFARSGHAGRERAAYSQGLLIAAAIYPVFALVWGDGRWLAVEIAGVVVYGAFAWLGRRKTIAFAALGWLLHPIWDVALHLRGPGSHIVPAWYAIACISFDLLLAAAIVWRFAVLHRQASPVA